MFIYLIITIKLVFVIKVYWLFMVECIVYVMLFSFINERFNFNYVVGEPIINKGLFYIIKFVKEDSSLVLEISVFMIVLL